MNSSLFELFQIMYVYISLVFVLFIVQTVKNGKFNRGIIEPLSIIFSIFVFVIISVITGRNQISGEALIVFIFLFFSFIGTLNDNLVGMIFYILSYVLFFIGFNILGTYDFINIGFDIISVFAALLAIVLMNLKKQDNFTTAYIFGMFFFFMTSVLSGNVILTLSSILIVLSRIFIIYIKEKDVDFVDDKLYNSMILSSSLFSYGVLLLPISFM